METSNNQQQNEHYHIRNKNKNNSTSQLDNSHDHRQHSRNKSSKESLIEQQHDNLLETDSPAFVDNNNTVKHDKVTMEKAARGASRGEKDLVNQAGLGGHHHHGASGLGALPQGELSSRSVFIVA